MTPAGDRPGWLRLAWQWLKRPMVDPLEIIAQNRSVPLPYPILPTTARARLRDAACPISTG
jgi:hypothetical protein